MALSLVVVVVGLLLIALVVGGVIALVIVLANRNKRGQTPAQPAANPPTAAVSQEQRQAILKKLADGELSREQAEDQLSQLGSPVPSAISAPPATGSGMGKGCLIAIIVAALFIPLLLLILGGLVFGLRVATPTPMRGHKVIHMAAVPIEQTATAYEEVGE